MKIVNIIFALILSICTTKAISDESQVDKGVGFKSVAEALAFLKTKSSVTFTISKPDGWLIANESSPFTLWSFTPSSHYAHPAVVKREVKQSDKGDFYIEMTALCQAEKSPCDLLITEFQELNNKIIVNKQ